MPASERASGSVLWDKGREGIGRSREELEGVRGTIEGPRGDREAIGRRSGGDREAIGRRSGGDEEAISSHLSSRPSCLPIGSVLRQSEVIRGNQRHSEAISPVVSAKLPAHRLRFEGINRAKADGAEDLRCEHGDASTAMQARQP